MFPSSRAFHYLLRALLLLSCSLSYANVITFEDLPDTYFFNGGGQNIGSFYPGVTFGPNVTGLSVTRFGGYANDAFPPHSGDVVIWDASDPTVTIGFSSPIQSFGIWYTSFDPLTLRAFDGGNNLLGSVMGTPNTDGTSGTTSFLSFTNPVIRSVDITSSAGLFTLDDLSFQSGQTTVPEPRTALLVGSAFLLLLLCRQWRRARESHAVFKLMSLFVFASIVQPLFCQTMGIPPELTGLIAPSPPSVRVQVSTFAALSPPSVGAVTAQTSDTTPPQLTGLTFTPSTINVSSAPQNVTVTLQITDDLSGADFSIFRPAFEFVSPSGNQIQLIESTSFSLISGTPLNGAWRATATFPQFAEPGTWKVSFVTLFDAAGNNVTLNTAALTAAGFPTTLAVTTTVGDTTPPQLTGLTFSRTGLDVTSSSQTVDITATVTDNLSGVDFSCHAFCIYSIGLTSPSGKQQQNSANYNFTQVSGTPLNGQWKTTITIPRYSEAGTWTINGFHIWDTANNTLNLSTAQIQALGLPTTISVTDSQPDTTAPHITSLAFNPAVAGSSPFRQLITVTLAANDDISGVDFIGGFATPEFSNVSIQLVSPTAIQTISVNPYNNPFGLRSGNALNGVWQTSFILPGYSQTGTWTVASATLRDSAANYATFNTSQLNALGITTVFTVSASAVVTTFLGPAGTTANPTASIAEPVNTATGNYYSVHTDISVRGRGLSFVFNRYYNSLDYYSGPLGVGWTHSYNVLLSENPQTGTVTVKNGNGSTLSFTPTGGGSYTAATGVHDQLTKNTDGSFTLTRMNRAKLMFSGTGQLSTIADRNGNRLTMAYDGFGNLTSITDTVGRIFRLAYDSNNHLVSVTDPSSRQVKYSYDANSNLTGYQDASGGNTQYGYDASQRLISGTDARNIQYVQNTYDAAGRVVSQKNGRGATTAFAYNSPSSGITTITDPLGNITRHVYDGSSRLVQVIDSQGGTTTYAYDSSNNRTSITSPNGKSTQFTYDGNGNVTGVTNALGTTATLLYDTHSNLIKTTSPVGRSTTFIHDSNGNLTAIRDALGNQTTFTYDSSGQLVSRTNALGKTMAYTYDSNGNLTRITDPLHNVTKFGYDGLSRVISITDSNGHASSIIYDVLDRRTRRTDALGHQLQYSYDAAGNLVRFTDPNGQATNYTYDAVNELISLTDALGNNTAYSYDLNGNKVSFRNGNGKVTTYQYDSLNRRTRIIDAAGNAKAFIYDPVGNVTAMMDGNGRTHRYSYDGANRRLAAAYADGNTVSYSYDADGVRTGMADSSGTTQYQYDLINRLTGVINASGKSVAYVYDSLGRRTAITYPDARVVTYSYDDDNRLSQTKDWLGRTTAYTYDPAGNMMAVSLGNGVSTTFGYDNANRLTSVVSRSGIRTLSAFAYLLDSAGNRLQVTDAAGGVSRFAYDVLNRLSSWAPPSGQITSYAYDAAGNRLAVTGASGTTPYTYDAADRLISAGGATYTYDGNGNRVSRGSSGVGTSYTFDSMDRLIAVTTGGNVTQFQYDGDGNRIAVINGSSGTGYVSDIGRPFSVVLNESGPNGNVDYQYGLSLLSATGSSFEQFYEQDGLRSTASVSDASGAMKAAYAYDPWGKPLNPIDPLGTKNAIKFAGAALDATGLYYLRARYYDPAVGSFISKDPLGVPVAGTAAQNRYSYARNNPVSYFDPSGLSAVEISSGGVLRSGAIGNILADVSGDFSVFTTNTTVNVPLSSAPPPPTYANNCYTLICGAGVLGGGTAYGGSGPVAVGGTASAGGGIYWGGSQGVNAGGFYEQGGFVGTLPPYDSGLAGGGAADVGGGVYVTNATSNSGLVGPFNTTVVDLGPVEIQFGISGETYIASGTLGFGGGWGISNFTTTTTVSPDYQLISSSDLETGGYQLIGSEDW